LTDVWAKEASDYVTERRAGARVQSEALKHTRVQSRILNARMAVQQRARVKVGLLAVTGRHQLLAIPPKYTRQEVMASIIQVPWTA
jgi:hypothetical protein